VALSATDATSGVATTYYTINGGAAQTYTGPFSISSQGADTVNYWSIDAAGNTEAPNALAIKIDTVPPVTKAVPSGNNVAPGWYLGPVTISLPATDATSGVATTYYTINGGQVQTYSGAFTVSTPGRETLNYWSTDNAGNVENTNVLRFGVGPVAFSFTAPPGAGSFSLTVTSDGQNINLLDSNNHLIDTQPIIVTTEVDITGSAGTATHLTIDDSSGALGGVKGGVHFTGDPAGAQGSTCVLVSSGDFTASVITIKCPNVSGQIAGNFRGSLSADASGVITQLAIQGSLTGSLAAPIIQTLNIGQDLASSGQVTGQVETDPTGAVIGGSGALGTITIGGFLNGSITGASIASVSVGADMNGKVTSQGFVSNGALVAGTGTIGTFSITRSLTSTGAIVAPAINSVTIGVAVNHVVTGGLLDGTVWGQVLYDPPSSGNDVPGTGIVGTVNVNAPLPAVSTGTVKARFLTSLHVAANFGGSVLIGGSEGDVGDITVDGGLTDTSNIDVTGDVQTVVVTGDDSGTLDVTGSGSIGTLQIGGNASGMIESEQFTGNVTIGKDLSGTLMAL
jgi:hypothetical protein